MTATKTCPIWPVQSSTREIRSPNSRHSIELLNPQARNVVTYILRTIVSHYLLLYHSQRFLIASNGHFLPAKWYSSFLWYHLPKAISGCLNTEAWITSQSKQPLIICISQYPYRLLRCKESPYDVPKRTYKALNSTAPGNTSEHRNCTRASWSLHISASILCWETHLTKSCLPTYMYKSPGL